MTFGEKLSEYIRNLDTTYTGLAKASGLSVSTISNYVKGEREPSYDSREIKMLTEGIAALYKEAGKDISVHDIILSFSGTFKDNISIDYDSYLSNLNSILKMLGVKGSSLAKALSYDPSHISKILSGQRRPGDVAKFTSQIAKYISTRYSDENSIEAIAHLINKDAEKLGDTRIMNDAIVTWLGSNKEISSPVESFLGKMDSFNLDDFLRSIHFDDIKVPTLPFQFPTTKTYQGLSEIMESELDFNTATFLSKSKKDCIFYSDMPMGEMAKDPEFPKKWMFGRALMLKKGLNFHIIHDVNRPFSEMMLGLETYLPMYMTGQITPYYLPDSQSSVFCHLIYVSGAAALVGTAISGHHSSGRYILYKSKSDVEAVTIHANQLLKKSLPLMEVYRNDKKTEFSEKLHELGKDQDIRVIHSSIPLFTMSDELLEKILKRNNISEENATLIKNYLQESREEMNEKLKDKTAVFVIPKLNEKNFKERPLNLDLCEIFFEDDIPYTYEEYISHVKESLEYAKNNKNLTITEDAKPNFSNITYIIIGNKAVIVSKNKFPTIHFIIYHKRMIEAFSDYIPPIRDND